MANAWGNFPPSSPAREITLAWREQCLPTPDHKNDTLLPYGQGRSYGDVCLNNQGSLIHSGRLDHLISWDRERGILHAEAGLTLENILAFSTPQGWFLPVTPGTAQVSLGGAIANDVHGKNHHRVGCFGHHVLGFELLRSDGSRRWCSSHENTEWFRASIGGLGLTGFITHAQIQLKPIPSANLDTELIRQRDLAHFIQLSESSASSHEYTVAWIDCLSPRLGKGLFMRANHTSHAAEHEPKHRRLTVPCFAPSGLLNEYTLRAFNKFYYNVNHDHRRVCHFRPWLYPLDNVRHWNRLYGRRGFVQHQSIVPDADALARLLQTIVDAAQGSFLAVLKQLGKQPSLGLMSFCRPGYSLALDFPMRGQRTFHLLHQLDEIVLQNNGCIYPAKDACMAPATFQAMFPQWRQHEALRDPNFSSSFWRRVTQPLGTPSSCQNES
jgi:FAD/FMN-containing dehydrogenase